MAHQAAPLAAEPWLGFIRRHGPVGCDANSAVVGVLRTSETLTHVDPAEGLVFQVPLPGMAKRAELREAAEWRATCALGVAVGPLQRNGSVRVYEYKGPDLVMAVASSRFRVPQLLSTVAQVAAQLRTLHAAAIVHGDVKPDNIAVRLGAAGACSACLLDFGNSLVIDSAGRSMRPYYGTAGYSAGAVRGALADDLRRVDMHALGRTLEDCAVAILGEHWRILAGERVATLVDDCVAMQLSAREAADDAAKLYAAHVKK